jgi:hypothetical protein
MTLFSFKRSIAVTPLNVSYATTDCDLRRKELARVQHGRQGGAPFHVPSERKVGKANEKGGRLLVGSFVSMGRLVSDYWRWNRRVSLLDWDCSIG